VPALVAAAALVALALTGCTSASSSSSCVQPGDASSQVKASGGIGTPKASFPKPLQSSTLQKSVLHDGRGKTIADGSLVAVAVSTSDGTDGSVLAQESGGIAAGGTSARPGLQKALTCTTVGSRIAITGTAAEIYGADLPTGLSPTSPLVLVADVASASLARADGAPRPAQPGMPTVVLAPNGQPGIKIPSHGAPTKLASTVLKQGSGATVTVKGHYVVNYTAVAWSDPTTVSSSSWTDGSPVVWPDTTGQSYSPPASVLKELVGKQVCSQIIVVTPGSSATAFVIDILGIWK